MKYYENIYYYGKYTVYILYFLTYLGLWDEAPTYLEQINYYLKLLIALLLVFFFNPFSKKREFTTFHRNIAFSAGFFLLTTITLTGIKNQFLQTYNTIHDTTKGVILRNASEI